MSEALEREVGAIAGHAPLFRKLRPHPNGPSREQVVADQRARLRGAIVQAVARHGCGKVSGEELCRLAAVSKHTLYEHYGDGVNGCLTDACEQLARRAVSELRVAAEQGRDWRARLDLLAGAFARGVAREPQAARLALLDVHNAGPRASGAIEAIARAGEALEGLLADCFEDAPAGADPPALVLKGVLEGAVHVARAHLLAGRHDELPDLAGQLAAWACACCAKAPARHAPPGVRGWAGAPRSAYAPAQGVAGERLWLLEACARLAAEHGQGSLGALAITREAGVRRGAFRRHFADVRECLLAAHDVLCGATLADALSAASASECWSELVARTLGELAGALAGDPVLARLAHVEILAAGGAGVAARTRLLESFAAALRAQAPDGRRPNPLAVSAGAGAAWGIAGHLVASGRAQRLPANRRLLARMALA